MNNRVTFIVTIVLSILTFPSAAQHFFKNDNSITKYKSVFNCKGGWTKWKTKFPDSKLQYMRTNADTLIYAFKPVPLGNPWANLDAEGNDSAMFLKIYKGHVFLSYDKAMFTQFPSFHPRPIELLDMTGKVGTSTKGRGYFNYDSLVEIKLTAKRFTPTINDTLYFCRITGISHVSHALRSAGFVFCKSLGFVSWEFYLTKYDDQPCKGYLVNRRYKGWLVFPLNQDL
jgi:hypothetical protein